MPDPDAQPETPDDLDAQLNALMAKATAPPEAPVETSAEDSSEESSAQEETQAGDGTAAAPADASGSADSESLADPVADVEAGLGNIESQLDDLMAKAAGDEKTAGAAAEAAASVPVDAEETSPPDASSADAIEQAESALDAFEDAFETVQDVVTDLPAPEPELAPQATESEPEPHPEPVAAAEPEPTPAAEATAPGSELADSEDELAAQIQALLDETADEQDSAFVSPDELLAQDAQEAPAVDEEDELLGGPEAFVSPEELLVETVSEDPPVAPAPEVEAQVETAEAAPADDAPLIDQIDGLLADHAQDVIAGEFEDVDAILGVPDTSGENVADPVDDLEGDFKTVDELDEPDDDELEGGFESLNELLEPEEPDKAQESADSEDDEACDDLDGMFMPPSAVSDAPPVEEASPLPEAAAEEDEVPEGDFASLDAMLNAPVPSPEDAEGAPPDPPTSEPVAAEPAKKSDPAPRRFKFNPAVVRAAAVVVLGGLLSVCALVNKPLDKLPDDMKQAVGWVALAVAGPGLLLVGYGLLFN